MRVLTPDAAGSLRDPSPGPAAVLETKEKLSLIDHFLDSLSENQREVVRLKFQNGMSYKKISEITGLSVSNVGFLIHTAVKTLREQVKTDSPGQGRLRRVK